MKRAFKFESIVLVAIFSLISLLFCACSKRDIDSMTFPIISINTSGGAKIESKEEYIDCIIDTSNTDREYKIFNKSAKIKGRGHSTWNMPKKPYKIKFDSKVDLFGNGKAKKWTLIANYCDKSLSRNLLAYNVAECIELPYTTSTKCVNLFLNKKYQGVYLLCEEIEINTNRVEISDGLASVDTGYIIEMDEWAKYEKTENVDYFVLDDRYYSLKDPDIDDAGFTQAHFNFIKNYITDAYNSLDTNNYEMIKEYIDVDSFAKCYIVHELFNNIDVGGISFYFYKDTGGKLCAGPVWDFDISSGNCDYADNGNNNQYLFAKSENVWYNKLLEYEDFNNLVGGYLLEYKDIITQTINKVVEYQIDNSQNNLLNFKVWPILNKYVWPNPQELVKINSWEGQLSYVNTWLLESLTYLLGVYSEE